MPRDIYRGRVSALNEQQYLSLIRGEQRGLWPSLLRLGLRCLSVPYGVGARVRNHLFQWGWKQSRRAAVPVVSIGNLTVGGTGKTPCVEHVAHFYRDRDIRVAVLSRGYGGDGGCNDEALVLEQNLPDVPHLQDPDRVALAQIAVDELESELLILDDGFQHRRLERDLDIVLIDSTTPWGHGYLLPRGLLREPASSLSRADVVVLTRCNQVSEEQLQQIKQTVSRFTSRPIIETIHQPTRWINCEQSVQELPAMLGRPVACFSGVGNPNAFRQTVESLSMQVVDCRAFADHHNYTRDDVDELRRWAKQQPDGCILATTQKDLVKIQATHLGGRELWALQIELQVQRGQDEWCGALEQVLVGGDIRS